ncbi:CHAT domain-containing protein [Occultella glacieicola]|uniref:CHAT domain-containing protein n=1 Tax=Occultella glacieicola TaxID=2518684 RepID=A0ABY2DZV5_9MICO|nr:CHAT domain-containing protein [Occultella glacieicola]TDE90413.1 CHAT domain-containing protein [Occultella glacieicola]
MTEVRAYLDLDLALVAEPGGSVRARVLGSPAGVADAPFVLPFTAMEVARFLVATGPARTPARGISLTPNPVDVEGVGRRLHDAVFVDDVRHCFDASLSIAEQAGKGLRIRLHLGGAPELAGVPWEYLYASELNRFLTLSTDTPLVRFLDTPVRTTQVRLDPPLRVLVLVSSPRDVAPLDVEREKDLLRTTTADLVASGSLELEFVESATHSELQRAIYDDFHVFHFIGHGAFDDAAGTGVLLLERDDAVPGGHGTSHLIPAVKLGTLLHDAKALQLAVLNACQGAQSSGQDVFSGVGQTLVRQGLPAVVAMQSEISDRAAIAFSHEFYYALASGRSVEEAMVEARKAIYLSDESSEWGTPVLLRSAAEHPFLLSGPVAMPSRDRHWDAMRSAAHEAAAAGTPGVAVPLLQQLVAENPDDAPAASMLAWMQTGAGAAVTAEQLQTERLQTEQFGTEQVHPAQVNAEPHALHAPLPPHRHTPAASRRRLTIAAVLALVLAVVGVGGYVALQWLAPGTRSGGGDDDVIVACGSEAAVPAARADLVSVPCALRAPVIDGDMSEWALVPTVRVASIVAPAELAGATDPSFSSTWRLVWTREFLYVQVDVVDPARTAVDPRSPSQYWNGDGVSFEFGSDPAGLGDADPLRPDDLHVLFGVTTDRVLTAANAPGRSNGTTFEPSIGDLGVAAELRNVERGYAVEAAIPWSVLNVTSPPTRGEVFGMNLNVSDARVDGGSAPTRLSRMISSNPIRSAQVQNTPGRWHTVVLVDPND